MKRILWTLSLLLGVSACSKGSDDGANQEVAPPQAEVAADAMSRTEAAGGDQPPAIDASIAPGVAFDYQFAFSLPEKEIAAMQSGHAGLCARIGVSQCRVVGLTFNKSRNGDIDAAMTFKLDPALALSFTRDATDLVNRADGKLETSQVQGSNVGDSIVQDDKSLQAQKAELARLTAEQKIPGLSKTRRDEISREIAAISTALNSAKLGRGNKVERLATTPVRFNYEPTETILGFGRESPVQQGLSSSSRSLNAFLTFFALVVGTLWPWALAGFGVWWVVRRLRARGKESTVVE